MGTFMKILVNMITISRLIFTIILVFIINNVDNIIFIILITFFFLTDFVDGYLARKFKVQTLFGSIVDTLADKVLSIVLIFPLLTVQNVLLLNILGEIIIASTNIIGRIEGKLTKVSLGGKIKMWLLSLTIICGYFNLYYDTSMYSTFTLSILTFIIQIVVFINYIYYLIRQPKIKEKSIDKGSLLYILFNTEYYLKNH